MRSDLLKSVLRGRAEFGRPAALPPARRRSDRALLRHAALTHSERRSFSEARLVLCFFSVLVCTVLGVVLEEMRMPGAAWSLFIVGAAFLLAAVRALFMPPGTVRKRRPHRH